MIQVLDDLSARLSMLHSEATCIHTDHHRISKFGSESSVGFDLVCAAIQNLVALAPQATRSRWTKEAMKVRLQSDVPKTDAPLRINIDSRSLQEYDNCHPPEYPQIESSQYEHCQPPPDTLNAPHSSQIIAFQASLPHLSDLDIPRPNHKNSTEFVQPTMNISAESIYDNPWATVEFEISSPSHFNQEMMPVRSQSSGDHCLAALGQRQSSHTLQSTDLHSIHPATAILGRRMFQRTVDEQGQQSLGGFRQHSGQLQQQAQRQVQQQRALQQQNQFMRTMPAGNGKYQSLSSIQQAGELRAQQDNQPQLHNMYVKHLQSCVVLTCKPSRS